MSPRPLTVVHLATNRWWTGSADPTIQLAHIQQAHGYRVLLAVPPGDRFEAKAREAGLTLLDGVHLRARLAPLEIARDAARHESSEPGAISAKQSAAASTSGRSRSRYPVNVT